MKSRLALIVLSLLVIIPAVSGQVTEAEKKLRAQAADTLQGWKTGGVTALNLSQTSLKNWAAGGQNSLAINGIFSMFANLKSGKSVWDNSLDVGYGLLKQGSSDDFMKTDDKIDFLSKYGQEAFKNFYYAGLLNFKTQMAPGYNYPNTTDKISGFLAPGYLLAAIGMDFKPNNYLSAFIAPLTSKFTFVTDEALSDAGAFGVTPGKKTKSELGGYVRMIYTKNDFTQELLKNISYTTKLDLFSNYLNKPENIDVSWETLIMMKVNKYITVSFNTHLIYDDDVKIKHDSTGDGVLDKESPKTQFKQILGVGFSYKF